MRAEFSKRDVLGLALASLVVFSPIALGHFQGFLWAGLITTGAILSPLVFLGMWTAVARVWRSWRSGPRSERGPKDAHRTQVQTSEHRRHDVGLPVLLLATVVAGLLCAVALPTQLLAFESLGWRETKCEILSVRLERWYRGSLVRARYRYSADGAEYTSDGVGFTGVDAPLFGELFAVGDRVRCFYSPSVPSQAVLYRDFSPLALACVAGFGWLLLLVVRRRLASGGEVRDAQEPTIPND